MNTITIEPETKRGQIYRLLGYSAKNEYIKKPLGSKATTETSGVFEIDNIQDDGERYLSYVLVFESNGKLLSVALSKTNATAICKALNESSLEEILNIQERDNKLFFRVRNPSEIIKRATLRDHKDLIETVWGYLKDLKPREIRVIVSELKTRTPPVE